MPIQGTQRQFTDQNIQVVPAVVGVYALWESDELIYFGSSEASIRHRLQQHKEGQEGSCTAAATHFAHEATTAAVSREKELLQEFERTYSRLPRCNERIG